CHRGHSVGDTERPGRFHKIHSTCFKTVNTEKVSLMNNKVKKPLQTAIAAALIGLGSVSVLLPSGGYAQNAPAAPVPTSTAVTALPDFTSIVAATENAVVNIRTMEKVPTRESQGFG